MVAASTGSLLLMDTTLGLAYSLNGSIPKIRRWVKLLKKLHPFFPLQVTVHISDSEDESEEYITDEEREEGEEGDPEMQAGRSGLVAETGPPTSCIIPTYRCSSITGIMYMITYFSRRDCHEEVYAGSHTYPRQGVYQLKFDNSYSLWRSKTLYYRVYYTR